MSAIDIFISAVDTHNHVHGTASDEKLGVGLGTRIYVMRVLMLGDQW